MGSEGGDRETMWTLRETKCGLISNYVSHDVWLHLFQPLNFHERAVQIIFKFLFSLNWITKDSKEHGKYSRIGYFVFLYILA